ncbi:dihydrodipicolinate synthase family protein [Halalkalicoccus subterraneus]|uniref:dihydrodipicolinate synthase family protein n=1 Tax=Halalkalicoccus subterraneus TaxID=2675002 RepID=UPI000EFC7915|nr:dihydrodipicolinate synthase family protein [Halalkalicoccus subterraneus]
MSYDELQTDLAAVAFTTATPFGDDGDRVLTDEIERNVRTLYEAGARVFVPCGNTGEYYSLSRTERIDVVRTTVESLPDDATVIGGAGGSTKDTIELLEAYEDAGADAAMIMSPAHAYIHERGLIEYYRTLASSTDLGIVLYKRGPYITERVIDELASIGNVVAVKYAVNDVKAFSRLVETVSGDLVWLNGVAERYAPAYALEGADGFTTGIGNFVPEPVLELSRALAESDWTRAKRIRDVLRPFEDLREEAGNRPPFGAAKNVPAVKLGLDRRGMYGGPVREPLVELSEEDRNRVETYLDEIERVDVE